MRWQENAEEAAKQSGWEIIDTAGVSDYQGWGVLLLRSGGAFAVLAWFYGSCRGCDAYEDMSEDAVTEALRTNIVTFATEAEARMDFDNSKGW